MKLLTKAQREQLLDNGRRQAAVKGTPAEIAITLGHGPACLAIRAGSNVSVIFWRSVIDEPTPRCGPGAKARNERRGRRLRDAPSKEIPMPKYEDGHIVETPTEARQAEPGPSMLVLLTASLALAIAILIAVWTVFFKT